MKTFFVGVLIMLLTFVSGCTGRLVLMQNEKGDIEKCEVSASEEMMTGAFVSRLQVNRCVEQWESLGYRKVGK